MTRFNPMTWAAIHIAVATVATYLLYTTDALTSAAPFLIH